mgnify:CR=1 FL=1
MAKTVRFSVSISPDLLERFDQAIREKAYKNRSKAIRDLIVNFIVEREWERSEREVMGSLTMHTHIDEHNCMEILALRGYPSEIKEIADKILSCRGIKHGRLVMSITGAEIT